MVRVFTEIWTALRVFNYNETILRYFYFCSPSYFCTQRPRLAVVRAVQRFLPVWCRVVDAGVRGRTCISPVRVVTR